mgnify:CR=1 FL=1|tara:strand:+ start:32894 stop:34048 length:1155 start_codon:yes stop_codon:yes gene_type:complete
MSYKIIYISILPLDKNNYERFGIEIFKKRGWNVEYWIFFGKYASNFNNKNLFYKNEKNFLVFKSIFQIFNKIKKIKSKNFYFINIGQPWFIERLMKIAGGKKIIIDRAGYPEVYNVVLKNFLKSKFSFKKFFNFFTKAIRMIFNKITNKLRIEPTHIFTAGNISGNITKLHSNKTKVIKSYSYDYDRYLKLKQIPLNKNFENSIVYIDQHLEGNYEFLLTGENVMTSKYVHWNSIKNFLSKLSKNLDKKVIIAAHPKRDKNEKNNFDFEIVYNQTANLIKNSAIVVGHNSTAVSLVTLFQKPYTCIATDELMKNAYFYYSIKKYSHELGVDLINIDHFEDFDKYNFLKYDKNAYKNYIENYIITPDVKSENFWSDFIDYFENES